MTHTSNSSNQLMKRNSSQQRSIHNVVKDPSHLTMCRLKNVLVLTSGMLLPICPAFLLTLRVTTNFANQQQSITPSTAPIMNYSPKTWQEYLKNSKEQVIEGSVVERRKSQDILVKMELYFKRWVTNHSRDQDERLKTQCINTNPLCVFWAATGECQLNPAFMEEQCILACQRCDKLIDDIF